MMYCGIVKEFLNPSYYSKKIEVCRDHFKEIESTHYNRNCVFSLVKID